MQSIKTIDYKGYSINIYLDEPPSNPQTEFDRLGTIITYSHYLRPQSDRALKGFTTSELSDIYRERFDENETKFKRWFYSNYPGSVVILNNNSEYTFFMNFALAETISKESITRNKARKIMKSEIREFFAWCNGDVFGYQISIEVPNGYNEENHTEVLDSCWGFYGADILTHAISQAKETIDSCV